MTKLEQIIYHAHCNLPMETDPDDSVAISKAIASAVLPLITKAFDAGQNSSDFPWRCKKRNEWLSENITSEVKQEL
jgi:hypothetical protein